MSCQASHIHRWDEGIYRVTTVLGTWDVNNMDIIISPYSNLIHLRGLRSDLYPSPGTQYTICIRSLFVFVFSKLDI